MKHSLPCLTVLAMLAAVTAAVAQDALPLAPVVAPAHADRAPAATPVGDRLVLQTLAQLERHQTVTARLSYHSFVAGPKRDGTGAYWQQDSGDSIRVRLELRLQIEDTTASLLQVSNSRFLWTDQRLASGRVVTRVDLRKLRADPSLAAADQTDDIQPGQASWSAVEPGSATIGGGLPTLLSSLVDNFTFAPPQAMELNIPSPDGEPDGTPPLKIPVWAVVGRWRPERLAALVGTQHNAATVGQGSADGATLSRLYEQLPDRFPQEVLLMVGQADLFPHFIEYRRLAGQNPDVPPATPYQLSPRPMIVVLLNDVTYDVPVAPGQFDYTPGDADWADRTAEFRSRLLQRRERQVAARSGATSPLPR